MPTLARWRNWPKPLNVALFMMGAIPGFAAGDMAERAGFCVDELDDVRLAVDEVCAILLSADGRVLDLRMQAQRGARGS